MVSDANKGISSVEYNHLNLPTKVVQADVGINNQIDYIYGANGNKLEKTVMDYSNGSGGTPITKEYAGNYIYENGKLQFMRHPEGYVMPKDTDDYSQGFDYVYEYKDHLGNTRLSYTDADNNGDVTYNEIVKESNYYPFGLTHHNYNNVSPLGNSAAKKYMFGGKELDESLGLETYDFGARNYDPALGRWMNVDPLADDPEQVDKSPYAFAWNNPIRYVDPTGLKPVDDFIFNESGDFVRIDKNNKPDKVVIENSKTGAVEGTYNFADPSDAKAIESGTINKVVFVNVDRMAKMLGEAGAFDKTNRDSEWSYINTESKGGGKLDFSYSSIPTEFSAEGASSDPLTTPSPMLFLPEGDGSTHNHMNFGNFLWGAAGHSLGFGKSTLKAAAQYNSLFNESTNGYPSQWDSSDDQFSIGRGVDLSRRNLFRDRTWSPTTGLSAPPKKR